MYCKLNNLSRYWKIIVALFIVALVIRIVFCATLEPRPFSFKMKKNDFVAQTLTINKHQPPLYPLFIRTAYGLFGFKNYRALFIVQGIVSALVVPLLFLLVTHISTPATAFTAGTIAALYPNFVLHNITLLENSIGIFLTTVLMFILLIDCKESNRAIAAAVTTGIGIMLMPVFLYLLPGLLFVLKKRKLYLVVLTIVLLPLVIHNSVLNQKFVPLFNRSTWAIDLQTYQNEDITLMDTMYLKIATLFRKESKLVYHEGIDRTLIAKIYISYYSYILLLIAGMIGMIRFYRKEHRSIVFPMLSFVFLLVFIGRFDLEYRVLLEPLLIVYLSILLTHRVGDVSSTALPADQHR